MEVFDNLLRDDVGVGEVGAVFEAFAFDSASSRSESSHVREEAKVVAPVAPLQAPAH